MRRIRRNIEHSLKRRTLPEGTFAARCENLMKTGGERVWRRFRRHPSAGVVLMAGVGLVAAELVGVGEIALGTALGYAAYLVLRKGLPVGQALKQGERLVRP